MESKTSLRDRCVVNTNINNNVFVGIKKDRMNTIVYFPIGYQLPDNEDILRNDIYNLIDVLKNFKNEDGSQNNLQEVDFPIHAYIILILDFLQNGRYIIETENKYHTDVKGKVSWPRTIKNQKGIILKNGSIVYTNMTVKTVNRNLNNKITQIHKYCVYETFDKLGWLYVSFMPEKSNMEINIKESIYIINKMISNTNNDIEQKLFGAMKSVLEYIDIKGTGKQFSYGTEYFEHVWEKMIDIAFGIQDKTEFLPKAKWKLKYSSKNKSNLLRPDTILIHENKYYIIDAKYYRYGITGISEHLPSVTDIHKQITYGEYLENKFGLQNNKLYNCFIMPFNKENNPFMLNGDVEKIGEAIGEWKIIKNQEMKNYERIQGVIVDTRYIMNNYHNISNKDKNKLVITIEKHIEYNE